MSGDEPTISFCRPVIVAPPTRPPRRVVWPLAVALTFVAAFLLYQAVAAMSRHVQHPPPPLASCIVAFLAAGLVLAAYVAARTAGKADRLAAEKAAAETQREFTWLSSRVANVEWDVQVVRKFVAQVPARGVASVPGYGLDATAVHAVNRLWARLGG